VTWDSSSLQYVVDAVHFVQGFPYFCFVGLELVEVLGDVIQHVFVVQVEVVTDGSAVELHQLLLGLPDVDHKFFLAVFVNLVQPK